MGGRYIDVVQENRTYPWLRTNVDVDLGFAVTPGEAPKTPLVLLLGGAPALGVKACGIGHRDLEDVGGGRVVVPPIACRVRQTDSCLVPCEIRISGLGPTLSQETTCATWYIDKLL